MSTPERAPDRPPRARPLFWLVVIALGLVVGIAGLWKLSHLLATEPRPASSSRR